MRLVDRLRRTLPALERATVDGIDHRELESRIGAAIARHLGFDAACLATVDPVTAMWTHCSLAGMERSLALEATLFDAEYRADDVARLVEVARARVPGAPRRSPLPRRRGAGFASPARAWVRASRSSSSARGRSSSRASSFARSV